MGDVTSDQHPYDPKHTYCNPKPDGAYDKKLPYFKCWKCLAARRLKVVT